MFSNMVWNEWPFKIGSWIPNGCNSSQKWNWFDVRRPCVQWYQKGIIVTAQVPNRKEKYPMTLDMKLSNTDVGGHGYVPSYDNCYIASWVVWVALSCIDHVVEIQSDCHNVVTVAFGRVETNQLASLKATLIWNNDPVSYSLTGVRCRAETRLIFGRGCVSWHSLASGWYFVP